MIKFDNQEGQDYNPRNLSNSNHNNPASRGSSGFKNPRIVRVSRDFGGKDRHSKVWTVKGLKDRRIRLSIPTAIELYDLQDKLGLNQPSKVIDWLIDVTKDDIDKLPPLQMALEDFNRFHLPSSAIHQDFNSSSQLSFPPFFNSSPHYDHHHHHHQRRKGKETTHGVENYKLNSCNYNAFQPFYNLSLGHQLDTYASVLPSSLTNSQSCTPSISSSSSLCPPYFMHNNNHFQLLNSPNDQQVNVVFGLNMNSKAASSERNE